MKYDDIIALLKGETDQQRKQLLKDYAADRKELDARRRDFAPVAGKTFFYLFIDHTKRDECQMQTGIVENEKDKVRCSNDTRLIGNRIDEALKRNMTVKSYETADGVKHDGGLAINERYQRLFNLVCELLPMLEEVVASQPRTKFVRETVKPIIKIIRGNE